METGKPKPIQLFAPFYRTEEVLSEIRECLEKGWTGFGFKTLAFEEAWKEYSGFPHAHFVASCTAGLHMAVAILKERHGWADDDEIVSTPLTFVSTNHSILYNRMRPVFADIDRHLCLDPGSVSERIGPRTRAVMFVGHGGSSGELGKVESLCREKGLALILDAAHMAGTRLGGIHAGIGADAAVFSFHSVKNLPTADGGMLCMREGDDDRSARRMSWLGIDKDTYSRMGAQGTYKWLYGVNEVGWKYHGNSVTAAIGLVSLRYLDHDNAYRRQVARWYQELLGATPSVETVPVPDGCESSRHLYQILSDARDQLMVYLNAHGVYPGVHYAPNTDYPMYSYGRGTCPEAERQSARLVSLPLHLGVSRRDAARVVEVVRNFGGKRNG
jgi:dTDP-4-amino-4,6-dideoxygalactose transaminase